MNEIQKQVRAIFASAEVALAAGTSLDDVAKDVFYEIEELAGWDKADLAVHIWRSKKEKV